MGSVPPRQFDETRPGLTLYRRRCASALNIAPVLDTILEGGLVVDGTGTPGFVADVALAGDVIARIGDCASDNAVERIDCRGLVVAPGFIDMHGHSDEVLLALPTADSKVMQGVTLEVGGNCGSSPGPLSAADAQETRVHLKSAYDLELSWENLEGFFSALERNGIALNFCCLAGLGSIRAAAGGALPEPLDKEKLVQACALVTSSCEQGAVGVSSGLIYPPGSFADTDELIALCRAAARAGSPLYASHLRSEGDGLVEAVDEAIAIGRKAEVAVQLSHHKASGRRNWGKVHETLKRVERARAGGSEIALDQYPYKASSTRLDVILPKDVNVGTRDELAARLSDARYAALVAARVDLEYGSRWHEVLVSRVGSEKNQRFEGMTIAEVARASGQTPVNAALNLLLEERFDVAAVFFTMCEDDVRTVLSYSQTCIGSDAGARALVGLTSRGKPHPRAYGTFPRVLKRYVRDARLLTLPEAVRRATLLPATRLGLRRRGAIVSHFYADLVVFDASEIADTATYSNPHSYPLGVHHVFVNGVGVVRQGAVTGELPGRIIRRGRDL